MTSANQDDLWAITSYFNPMGYQSRLDNYHVFRRHLKIPLMAVELVFDGNFQLKEGDADRLIPIHGKDIMWQKERLLNIALRQLPDSCRYVMWLDCDLVFERQDLAGTVVAALGDNTLIQPYSLVYDLMQNFDGSTNLDENVVLKRESMAWQIRNGTIDHDSTEPDMLNHYSPGHAWAVRRDAVEQTGFYDAMILGSGDLAMAKAAIGRCEDVMSTFSMNACQAEHYRTWSNEWDRAINGRIGVVDGVVRHLWHGDLENRGYQTRYARFNKFSFDPNRDIAVGKAGCWNWSSNKPSMHEYTRRYFESRKEDGE
jgi:hypothetical protein